MADEPLYGKKKNPQAKAIPISDFRKQAFLEWLCTPAKERKPKNMEDFADTIQVTRRTLTNWKVDKDFLEAWEKLYLKTIGNPERKQSIMDTLYATASDKDDPKHVAAAKQYFEIEGSVKPAKMEMTVRREASELSDDELQQLLATKVGDELAARRDRDENDDASSAG